MPSITPNALGGTLRKLFIREESHVGRTIKSAIEIIIAKNNNGSCGWIKCLFDRDIGKFSNLEEDCF